MKPKGWGQKQHYLSHTTTDFVFHTLLQALQLVLEKRQVLKLGQRILRTRETLAPAD